MAECLLSRDLYKLILFKKYQEASVCHIKIQDLQNIFGSYLCRMIVFKLMYIILYYLYHKANVLQKYFRNIA